MSGRLFVGNLGPRITESQLARFFASAGLVATARIPIDRQTGQSRGFGFVEFPSREQAEQALAVFDGRELGGRTLRLGWAREPENRNSRVQSSPSEVGEGDLHVSGPGPPPVSRRAWESTEFVGGDDYTENRRSKPPKRGKHGSDRKRRRSTRRFIE